ncbi:MAG: phosphoribosylformylglycinamidine synthase I [Planctomycetaceae bacterium]
MAAPKVCVLRAPGTNCDIETAYAFEKSGGQPERIHVFRLLEEPNLLDDFQILCIPGGFSYGDDIGAGVILSRQLRGRVNDAIIRFMQADKLALGICNGFQTLLKAGLLTQTGFDGGDDKFESSATLTWNDNGKYTALWVNLKVGSSNSVFLKDIDEIEMPIAHAEGRIAVTSDEVLENWQEADQIALRYTNGQPAKSGEISQEVLPYPANPNGSLDNIAGLCDPTGRVLGLMPHPERFIHATQHPQWTRLGLKGDGDGLKLFQNAVNYFA